MRYLVFTFTIFIAFSARAQGVHDYTVTVTRDDLTIIDKALEEMPFKYAAPVLQKLNTQIIAQDTKKQDAPKEEKPK